MAAYVLSSSLVLRGLALRLLAEESVVFAVRPNPEPDDSVGRIDSHSPVVQSYASRPLAARLFEMERRMPRVCLK